MLDFIANNWLNILLILVGLSAFGVYFWQKRDERKTAATLVKEQIDIIEDRICALKNDHQLGNISVYHSRIILQENLWERYKHILIKGLSKSDAKIMQKFFDSAEQIEHARSDIIQTINNSWEHKSLVEHQQVAEFIQEEITKKITTEGSGEFQLNMNKVEAFRQIYRPLDLAFTPDLAINALVKHLNDYNALSGTTAYEKIQKLSYEK